MSYIQVPVDGAGKKLRTIVVDGEHIEVVTLAAEDGTILDQPLTDTELRATSIGVLDKTSPMPLAYDYMSLTYTGEDLTGIVYKVGGSGGTTVATVTMTYLAGKLQTWART